MKMGILDTGATLEVAPKEDEDVFIDMGKPFQKVFMFPYKRTSKATKKMMLQHNLCPPAREMNIVLGLHSTLISIPKLADAGYTTIFAKKEQWFMMRAIPLSRRTTHHSWRPSNAN